MSSCYAIINYASESVNNNIHLVMEAINNMEEFFSKPIIFANPQTLTNTQTKSWQSVDAQYEEAKKHKIIIVFGGDGTKTYILNRIIEDRIHPCFWGISCGTMNIGPYSTPIDLFLKPQIGKSEKTKLNAIMSEINGKKYYSFIDTVITTTCVTKVNGKVSQISAAKIMEGIRQQDIPAIVGNLNTKILVNIGTSSIIIPPIDSTMSIGVALISKCLSANIMAGGADPAACIGYKWGVIVSDFPLTWADPTVQDMQQRAIKTHFLPLKDNDTVEIDNCVSGAYCVIDGNAVSPVKRISISYCKQIIEINKLKE